MEVLIYANLLIIVDTSKMLYYKFGVPTTYTYYYMPSHYFSIKVLFVEGL